MASRSSRGLAWKPFTITLCFSLYDQLTKAQGIYQCHIELYNLLIKSMLVISERQLRLENLILMTRFEQVMLLKVLVQLPPHFYASYIRRTQSIRLSQWKEFGSSIIPRLESGQELGCE